MVIDSSALVAIYQLEPERERFVQIITMAASRRMSVASYVECSVVLQSRRGLLGHNPVDAFVAEARIELVPVDVEQAKMASIAFARFGKGHHRAGLNFGDCFSYALAKRLGEPLLFKGNDFIHTDIEPARLNSRA